VSDLLTVITTSVNILLATRNSLNGDEKGRGGGIYFLNETSACVLCDDANAYI
jgi:hypothetical protein